MESPACNLCGGTSAVHWLTSVDRVTGESFDILRCRQCGLRYTSPRPSADEMMAFYPKPHGSSWSVRHVRCWLRRRRARGCAAGLSPARVLEIGCGDGWMLDALRQAGWEVVGTERSEESAARPRSLGLDVHVGDLTQCGFPSASFDLVILWHTLEHLHDPLATLIEVRRVMCPSGRLVVATPNIDGWQARVASRRWFHLDVPRHLYHFDPDTLAAVLDRAGFRVRAWTFWSPAYEFRGWWELFVAIAGTGAAAHAFALPVSAAAMGISVAAASRKAGAAMVANACPVLR